MSNWSFRGYELWRTYEKIITESFLISLNYKHIDPRNLPNPKQNMKNTIVGHIIIKFLKTSNKKNVLKTFRQKTAIACRRTIITSVDLLTGPRRQEVNGMIFLNS